MIATLLLAASAQSIAVAEPQTAPLPPVQLSPATADAPAVEPLDSKDDIVITARRRTERLQDVPIPVAVLDAEQLQSTGSYNVGKLAQIQPSVQFYSSNPRNSAPNIRGLGAPFGLTNDGIEQGVGIYVDQVYYARSASSTFDFLDVERVEILRGPQGSLYGKNTTAGAINVTSRAPTFDFEAKAEVSVGNYDFVQAKAAVSGPLVADKLALRLAVAATNRRGTIYNTTSGQWINGQDNLGLKGQLLWVPSASVNLTLAGDYNTQSPICCGQYFYRTGSTQRPLARQYAALAAASGNYRPPSFDLYERVTDLDSELRAKQSLGGVSVRAEWDVGPGTLTSVSAYRFWRWDPSNDRDYIGLPITTKSQNPSQQEQYTQEFRYASAGKHRLDYVVGLFAFYQKIDTQGLQVQGPLASLWLTGKPESTDPAQRIDGLTSRNDIHFKNTSLAAFGQLTWNLSQKLKLQPGIRLNYDKKQGSYLAVVTNQTNTTLTATQLSVLAPQSYAPEFSAWNLSYDLTASYQATRDVLAYATYAKSFKSGGINLSGLPLDAANNPIYAVQTVKPEKVDHFQIGLKSQFLDRKVTFNLTAYWTEIRDFQTTVTNSQAAVIRGYLANAARVRVRGVEAEFSARPSPRFNLYVNAAYTDARYIKFVDAPCPPELSGGSTGAVPSAPGTPGGVSPANCNISGQILPGVSKWALSYGAEYNLPTTLFGQSGQAYIGADGSYRSRWSSNPSRSAYTDVDGYALTNLRAGFRVADKWNLYGWVRNVFGVDYIDFLATQSGNTGLVVGQPGDPRTYGATFSINF